MSNDAELFTERARRLGVAVTVIGLLSFLTGCATAPAPEMKRLVWPPPPLTTRIEFVRSLFSDKDLGRDSTFDEKVLEFFTGKKPPTNRIAEPMGIAISDDGNRLYVSDYAQLSVFVFDFANKTFSTIGKDGLGRPMGIALDAEENVYVVEQEKKGVSIFSRSGESVRFITDSSIEKPCGIAIDRQRGKIYVVDTAHTKSAAHTVKIFDMQGQLIGQLGHDKGGADGQFLFPTYASVDKQGNVYVTDTLNSRVQMFDSDGKYVKRFGERGNSWGMFDKPKGVATDSFGNVYVVDSGWSNVQIFNQKGQILLFFGGRGPVPGMLQNPSPIAIDGNNRIYVGDYLNHRVEVYQLVNTSVDDSFLTPPGKAGPEPPGPKPATTN
jgi:DNA-binding beta-propeller fold protein YncE